ncbi:hypothetical protein BU26DRAFT_440338, partial [Trematosphaeria pertusa]
KKKTKTYNSGYSLVVTHLTTNPPVRCLNMAERTGSLVFSVLWSYVLVIARFGINIWLIRRSGFICTRYASAKHIYSLVLFNICGISDLNLLPCLTTRAEPHAFFLDSAFPACCGVFLATSRAGLITRASTSIPGH